MSLMKPIDDFLVQVEHEYEHEAEIGGSKIMLTSVFEDPFQLCKTAKIIATPSVDNGITAQVGDLLFFSHLIMKNSFNHQNEAAANDFLIDPVDKIYRVPPRLIYAYTINGELFVPQPFFICKPVVVEDEVRPSGIFLPGNNKEIERLGELEYINESMMNNGYKKGDKIVFSKDSEYEIKVFGERMYRMKEEWILADYER